ncbi:MAG TPA: metal ABC transporter substrate-binding protein [Actinomycetota bacterium]|nr:metal ABC transporter substrate-binding protein [Actinomycetota bacterium]
MRSIGSLVVASLALAGCTEATTGRRTLVASLYPLAFAAERVAGPSWDVIDLTPPGTEAHDVELSLADRTDLQRADLVIYLGDLGFQPQVEEAVRDLDQRALAAGEGVITAGDAPDPHVWLDPAAMVTMADRVADRLSAIDPEGQESYRHRADALRSELGALDGEYTSALSTCRYGTMIVSHEAFGYLARRYGLRQLGLAGPTPEGEPTASRLAEAEGLLRSGQAGAVFYEESDEARRIAGSVAADADVPALPLATLESRPAAGDYLSVMEENLASLRVGMECE